MVYASKEQYLSEHNTIPEEQIEKRLKQASRHIDSLTFNRITSRGFDNLTEFQQAIILMIAGFLLVYIIERMSGSTNS